MIENVYSVRRLYLWYRQLIDTVDMVWFLCILILKFLNFSCSRHIVCNYLLVLITLHASFVKFTSHCN